MRNVAKVSRHKRFEMEFFNFSSRHNGKFSPPYSSCLSLLLSFRLRMGLLGELKFINFKSRGTQYCVRGIKIVEGKRRRSCIWHEKIHRGNVFPMVKFNFLAEDERKKRNQKYRVTKQNYRRNTIDFKRDRTIFFLVKLRIGN